jgi:hypothetical protein
LVNRPARALVYSALPAPARDAGQEKESHMRDLHASELGFVYGAGGGGKSNCGGGKGGSNKHSTKKHSTKKHSTRGGSNKHCR